MRLADVCDYFNRCRELYGDSADVAVHMVPGAKPSELCEFIFDDEGLTEGSLSIEIIPIPGSKKRRL